MKHLIWIFSLLAICSLTTYLPASSQAYLFQPAEKLPSTINSSAEESYPILSPDGKTLYFTRFDPSSAGGRLLGTDIWVSQLNNDGSWGAANLLHKSLNNKKHNVVIGFNEVGDKMYLLNSYFSTLKSDVVSVHPGNLELRPVLTDIPKINVTDGFLGLYVHPSEKIILISMAGEDSFGQEDLYVMLKDSISGWSPPKNLGPMINTSGFEISPFLSSDGKTLFFSSNGHGGFGDADIFMSQRLYNTWNVWTRPENLGKNINSTGFDAFFTLTDKQQAFFVSNKEGQFADIYVSRVMDKTDSTAVKIQQLIEDAQRLLERGGGNP